MENINLFINVIHREINYKYSRDYPELYLAPDQDSKLASEVIFNGKKFYHQKVILLDK